MNNSELIPLENENDIDENSVLVVRRKKNNKKYFFKRLFSLILVVYLCYFVYKNFSDIKNLTNKIIDKISSVQNDSDSPSSDTNDTQDNTCSPNESIKIPSGANKIYEQTGKFTKITNEAKLDLDLDFSITDYSLVNEIYEQYGSEAPCVLIIHSSCLENYSNGSYYQTDDSFYSSKENVALVGKIICDTLNDNNINAIHIDEIFANGSINSSKKEYEKLLNDTLKKYPSISYVLDVSRDIIINDDLSMNKMVYKLNGENVAQIKLTIGASEKSFWHKNLIFANKIASENSDLIYDVTLSSFELSQNIKPISIRVEIGSYSNDIWEALLSGKQFALALSKILYQSW